VLRRSRWQSAGWSAGGLFRRLRRALRPAPQRRTTLIEATADGVATATSIASDVEAAAIGALIALMKDCTIEVERFRDDSLPRKERAPVAVGSVGE
jgi:hypothetical protein